ncbi:MAG: glycosyltransferase family 2 protein [Spirochaetales bacterium]|jgi:glycosyltransferase involved in cell wall biosynthesis|nr:glycosyltransferase family 2 protein [Spirochaetales bacterium]
MSNDDVMVSIILTTYKRSRLLYESVYSVLNGTYTNFEIIIVDDCSNDDTEAVANKIIDENRSFRIRYLKQEVNKGVLAARNRGFDEATGDLIAILDDDDTLVPDALEKIVTMYYRLPEPERGILWFDCLDKESNQKSGNTSLPEGRITYEDYLCGKIRGDFWLVFSKYVLDGQRFDERLRAHESLFWLKLHKDFPATYVPDVVCVKAREHGERLCDIEKRLEQLPFTLLAMYEFLDQFGTDLRRLFPRDYGRRLAYYGLHQIMIGQYREGRKSILNSLTFVFSFKYIAVYSLSFLCSKYVFQKIYVYLESNS